MSSISLFKKRSYQQTITYKYIYIYIYIYISSSSSHADSTEFPLTLSLSLVIGLNLLLLLKGPLDSIHCPHRADVCKSLLIGHHECVQV